MYAFFSCLYLRLLLCHQLFPCMVSLGFASFKSIFPRKMKFNLELWCVFFIFDPKIIFIWFLNCYFFCLSSIAIRNIFSDILLLLKIFLRKCSSNILRLRLHPRLQVSQCRPVFWGNTVTFNEKRAAIVIVLKMMTHKRPILTFSLSIS